MWRVGVISLRQWLRRGKPFFKNLFLFHVFLVVLLIGLNMDKLNFEDFGQTVPALAANHDLQSQSTWWREVFWAANLPDQIWKGALNHGLPVLSVAAMQNLNWNPNQTDRLLSAYVFNFTNVNVFDPKTYLAAEMNTLSTTDEGMDDLKDITAKTGELPEKNSPDLTLPPENIHRGVTKDKPLVGIYNTHNAETYIPTDGKSRLEGKNGGIAIVALELANTLEKKYGVPIVYADRIHDYPEYAKSYVNSAQTVKYLLKTYPSMQMLVDVHRDAMPSNDSESVEIDGVQAARILFIVGTDARAKHPNWQQNDQFAEQLAKKTEELYPGLLKGVRRKEGIYNQTLHPRAVLVEIGNDRNSLNEALVTARCLAKVIQEVLNDLPEASS